MKEIKPTIYGLQDGSFQVSFTNPTTGKRKRYTRDTEKAAKILRDEIERKLRLKQFAYFSDAYVGELIEQHLRDFPDSKFRERQNMFKSFYDEFAAVKIGAVDANALRRWFAKIKLENDYSDRTLNAIKTQINFLFRDLVEQELMESSPLDKIWFKRKPPPKRPRVVMSVDEVKTILTNAQRFSPTVLFPYLSTVAHTGGRRKEIVRLNRGDINFDTGLVHFKHTKNGHERWVRMSPTVQEVIRENLNNHNLDPLIVKDGKRIDHHGEIERLMDKFKMYFPMHDQKWGSHSLRHSFAYNFLLRGGKMYQLQAILGHRSIDVTIDLYGQLQAQTIECPSPYENNFNKEKDNGTVPSISLPPEG